MQIIALDLASKRLGWAARSASGRVSWGYHKFREDVSADVGALLHAYDLWLCDMLTLHAAERVYYEAPWVSGDTAQVTALKLMSMAGFTAYRCRRRRVLAKPTNVGAVRAHFIGSARMKREEAKCATIQACRLRGWDVGDDNDAADALAVLDYEASRLKLDGVIAGPLFAEARTA